MDDTPEPLRAKPAIVRARDAASLILLRGEGPSLELLAGRRPGHVRFMPGVYVFPGGAIDAEDNRAWPGEPADVLPPRLRRSARAALRETWEEVGVLVGSRGTVSPHPQGTPAQRAYAEHGVEPGFARLAYVGRAITPSTVFRRFNTRFFVADGRDVIGEPNSSDELEDVGWHPIGRTPLSPFRDVSQFMLAEAIAMRERTAPPERPLLCTVRNKRRIRICREGLTGAPPPG
jgi:8-oxo-dGTP pyrophosphatase MutT (NUDIX family)